MLCSDCEKRKSILQNNCSNVEQSIYVMNEYKIKKKLLINICEKYNNDIYNCILSFLCNDCISCKIDTKTFGYWCIHSPKLIKYLLDTKLYQTYFYYIYTFDDDVISPLHIALYTDINMVYDIVFSDFYDEKLMNFYCFCPREKCNFQIHDINWYSPLQLICKHHTDVLSILIKNKKITEKSITNDILIFCMKHNMKSLIIFLTLEECSQIIIKLIQNLYDHNQIINFLCIKPYIINLETCCDIKKILKLDLISSEFINHFFRMFRTCYNIDTILYNIVRLHINSSHDNNHCDCRNNFIDYIDTILKTLHETNKLTKELLSIKNQFNETILMTVCSHKHIKLFKTILSFDECDEDILSIQNNNGLNVLMLSALIFDNKFTYLLINSNKITKNILMQRSNRNVTIYDMNNIWNDSYLFCRLNAIYYLK